ncbi:MAG: S8 family serine peptidase [Dehalococcoidia bacterium]|nr:S8 family serine peptidase [Dehalococcoidia bacterium]
MRVSRWLWSLSLLAAAFLLANNIPYPSASSQVLAPDLGLVSAQAAAAEFVPGEVLVQCRLPLPPAAVATILRLAGGAMVERNPTLGLYRLRLPEGVDVQQAAALYSELPWVEYAEPNYIVRAATVPDDPLYPAHQAWYYDLINAPAGWDIERGRPAIIVAVLDTGVDLSHPDLQFKIWTNAREVVGNGIDDDGNGCIDDVHGCDFVPLPPSSDPSDDHGHGTMVAGIVGASSNNGLGVAGTAWGVTVLPVKVLDSTGAGTASDVAQGIIYAAKSGAQVINMSMARPSPSHALEQAVNEAHDAFGVVLVAASGNEGQEGVGYPAAYPAVIAVSAFGHSDPNSRAPFSNWGPEVDVTAPGVDVYSTHLGGGYAMGEGTSFATAFVSGLVALLLSQDSSRSDDDIRAILRIASDDLPNGSTPNWDGWGRLNMGKALQTQVYQTVVPGVVRG